MSDCVCLPKDATIELIDANLGEKTITENGRYLASSDDLDGYSAVDVNVSQSFTQEDEGKVVSNGSLVSQTSATYTENDTYDTTLIDEVTVNVSGGGGEDYLAKSLNDTLTSYSSNDVTNLPSMAFTGRTALQSISLPNVATLSGDKHFQNCTNLTNANLPLITLVSTQCFQNCTSLTSFDFSNLVNINAASAFENTGLTGVYFINGAIGSFASGQFAFCTELLYVRAPNHPSNSAIRQSTYADCVKLKLADVGQASSFSVGTVFRNCTSLETLILRRTSVTTLGNVNNFSGVTQTVNVYVPQDLIASYQTATNWSTLYNSNILSFVALEGSPYEQEDFVYMGVPS